MITSTPRGIRVGSSTSRFVLTVLKSHVGDELVMTTARSNGLDGVGFRDDELGDVHHTLPGLFLLLHSLLTVP